MNKTKKEADKLVATSGGGVGSIGVGRGVGSIGVGRGEVKLLSIR